MKVQRESKAILAATKKSKEFNGLFEADHYSKKPTQYKETQKQSQVELQILWHYT